MLETGKPRRRELGGGACRSERTKKLTHITMDLSAAFISAAAECAPQAQRVYDRFHIQKLANAAVDEVRRSEARRLAGTLAATRLKHSRWPLLKNPWNLTRKQGERLCEIQRTNKPLYRAYLIKEALAKALDYLQPARAAAALDEVIAWAKRSRLAPFVKLAGTLQRHRDGILAYIPLRLSNGLTEGLNNEIRLITRRAFGFHGSSALSAMIHLCCGGIVLDPPLPAPISST